MKTQLRKYRVLACIVLAFTHVDCLCQDSTTVSVHGTIGTTIDVYGLANEGRFVTSPRRPATVLRVFANPTVSFGSWLEVPIQVNITSREASIVQPIVESPDLLSILANPMNRFSIAPRFGPVQVFLGSSTPRYSSLVLDNAQVFGVSVEAKPNTLRLSATYGLLNRAVSANEHGSRPGSFARTIMGFRIGSEPTEQSRFGFTIARLRDDPASIPLITEQISIPVPIVDSSGVWVRDSALSLTTTSSLIPRAQTGVSVGFDLRMPITNEVYVTADLGGTGFTRDLNAPTLTDNIPIISSLISTNTSTRVDAAGKFGVGYVSRVWSIEGGMEYAGPGYVCLTQPFFVPDRLDITATAKASLFDGSLTGSTTIGWREYGISGMLESASNQLLANISAMAILSTALSINLNYMNFGYRTTRTSDSLRYEQVSQSIQVAPTYTVASTSLNHQLALTAGYDVFDDVTNQAEQSQRNSTMSVMLMYTIIPVSGPWSARASGSYMNNTLAIGGISMRSVMIGGTYRLFNGVVVPDVSVLLSSNDISGASSESQLTLRAGIAVRASREFNAFLRYQSTRLSSDDDSRAYSEDLASAGVTYSF